MKQSIVKRYVSLCVLAGMTWACAGPSDSANNNAQANSNSSAQAAPANPPVASNATPLAVQPIPPPAPSDKAADKPAAESNANSASATATSSGLLPKLVAPTAKLNFGKQPQDKTLVRTIAIRNGGRAVLNIESVTPS